MANMGTRDLWYKPNLLYNIHWRPPKKPEPPKMVVETVQFNPSVCTCREHDYGPRYRVERRVLWTNKEVSSTKVKTTEDSDGLSKQDTGLSKHSSKENRSEVTDVGGGQSQKTKVTDNSNVKKSYHEEVKLKIDDKRNVRNDRCGITDDGMIKYGYRERDVGYCRGRDGNDARASGHGGGVKTDGQSESWKDACFDGSKIVSKTSNEKQNEFDDRHSRKGGMKTEDYSESCKAGCENLKDFSSKTAVDRESCAHVYNGRTDEDSTTDGDRDRKYCGNNSSGRNSNGVERVSNQRNGGDNSGKSGDNVNGLQINHNRDREDSDEIITGVNGEGVERSVGKDDGGDSSGGESGDNVIGLETNANRDGKDKYVNLDIQRGSKNSVGKKDVDDGGGHGEGDESVSTYDYGNIVDGRHEQVPVYEEEMMYDDCDYDISPAFGIMSIYCNSEIHF